MSFNEYGNFYKAFASLQNFTEVTRAAMAVDSKIVDYFQ